MALLKAKSAANDAATYIAVPSFLIAPSIAASTNELRDTLRRASAALNDEYVAKVNARIDLNAEYEAVNEGGVTSKGIPYRSGETDMQNEMAKRNAAKQAKVAQAQAANARVKERQDKLEAQANQTASKMRRIKTLLTIIEGASRGPLLYDAAALLVTRTPDQQLIALSVLTKGAAVSFGDAGEYVTKDIRLVTALMDNPSERIELIK